MKLSRYNSILKLVKPLKYYHNHTVENLTSIPENGPCIIVCNHSLVTYDVLLLMKSIQDNKNRHIYTLVDRFLFRTKIQSNILSPLGARVGNEQNAKILAGNNLLITGGMKEMMKSSKTINFFGRTEQGL